MSRLRNPSQYSIPLARTERFKRSFVLYALRSFPTDISEDFCDDFMSEINRRQLAYRSVGSITYSSIEFFAIKYEIVIGTRSDDAALTGD